MRLYAKFLIFACVGASCSLLGVRNDDPFVLRDPTGYKLRPGDTVRITILGEPECTVEDTINNEERVRLFYIGDLPLANMTTKQAKTFTNEAVQI